MNSTIAENLFQEELYQIPGKIIVVIPKAWNEVSDEEKTQLSKIMNALKISVNAVHILCLQSVSLNTLLPLSPSKVISFGVPVNPQIKSYENTVLEGVNIIQADALDGLDDTQKRNLWIALKGMFNIQ